jgi:phosphoesterase RecJ-like protein
MQSKHVLVTAHKNPDGDSLGSQLGLARLLKSQNIPCTIINEGTIPDKYMFLPGIDSVRKLNDISNPVPRFDTAVVIECSNLERIGDVQSAIDDECVIINIDHHQDNTLFGEINLKEVRASAAGEIVFDIIRQGSYPIDKAMATNLYTAILTDTGRFHYSSTTPHCLKVAADLLEYGADTVEITENIYYNMKPGNAVSDGGPPVSAYPGQADDEDSSSRRRRYRGISKLFDVFQRSRAGCLIHRN